MSWAVLLGLVVSNAIWATNPVMGKILLEEVTPLQASWLRYGSAFVFALLSLGFVKAYRPRLLTSPKIIFGTSLLPWVFALGLITFFGSGVTQYQGLARSTSTANALLVALEPLFAVFLAWIFLGEGVRKRQAFAFLLAIGGFFLLSNVNPTNLMGSFSLFNFGNLLLLLTMPMEAMYTIISRRVAGRVQPLSLFASALFCGWLVMTGYVLIGPGIPSLGALSTQAWLALLWLGPLGTTITYVFWAVALVRAPVAAVCLTLFAQPILGALFSALFLGERLSLWQIVGGLFILFALGLQTTVVLKPAPYRKDPL